MDAELEVRDGSRTDIAVLAGIEVQAREERSTFRGNNRLALDVPQVTPDWERLIQSPKCHLLIGALAGIVKGYLVAVETESTAGRILLIEQVFVIKSARGLGLGESMINSALDLAKKLEVNAVDGLALPGDRETKNLYEGTGLKARLLIMTKDLQ